MSDLLGQLLRYKPGFLPAWIFLSIAGLCSIALICGLLFGLWFMSTQVDFL